MRSVLRPESIGECLIRIGEMPGAYPPDLAVSAAQGAEPGALLRKRNEFYPA